MAQAGTSTHYELLGVAPTCTFDELRAAYRRLARERHPDVAAVRPGPGTMAEVNEAWRVLSDADLRRQYDATVPGPLLHRARGPTTAGPAGPGFSPGARAGPTTSSPPTGARRQAWAAGMQAQMARLARQAGRSATQTLLIRAPRGPRSAYESVVDELVSGLSRDAESRVRSARAAGAAPLDLAVGATLVGIRTTADSMRRAAPLGISVETIMAAELLDRMWDVLAHELPVQLTVSLGGNPHVAQALSRLR